MNTKLSRLSKRYFVALKANLKEGGRASRPSAGGIGREALLMGLKTLDVAMMHRHALTALVSPTGSSESRDGILQRAEAFNRAEAFFVETIKPIEQSIEATMKSNVQLSQLNQTLRRRTTELASANRKLKREVLQRQSAEKSLKTSQQHYQDLLKRSQEMQLQLRRLSHELLRAQEEERKQISRELHDQVGQILTGINVHLATLKAEAMANTKGIERKISRTQHLVEQSLDIVHRFARDLRPTVLDDLGLIPALQSLLKDFTKQTGIIVRLRVSPGVEQLNSAKRTVLYRITQSALANITLHAKATRVRVSLRESKATIRLDIHDDGGGFDVERVLFTKRSKRLGLLGMRERVEMVGGRFSVESAPGKGTTICAQIPSTNGKQV